MQNVNEKELIWYGVMVDDDPSEIWYSSPNLDYVQKKIEKDQKFDAKKNRYHKYTIVNLGMVDA